MRQHSPGPIVRIAALALALALPSVAGAQSATPAASTDGITVAAAGLENPRGFAWGSDGTLYVALAGISDTPAAGDSTPVAPATSGGLDGSVVYVGDNTCAVTFQGVLPSAGGSGGIDLGPSDVVTVNGQVYVLDEGGGAAHGNPLTPDGIYALDGGGSAVVVADLGAWIEANPVANPIESDDVDGDPFAMATDGTSFWVTETEFGQLLNVTLDGTITRVADFSTDNQVPTGLAFGPDGTLYVVLLDQNSLAEGKSSVVSVAADGTTTTVWSGLTATVAVAVAQNGTLYALQIGTSTTDDLTNVAPGSGKVVRQTGADTTADVATGFDAPIGLAFGPDGGLYVSSPAFSPSASDGSIVRLNTNQGQVMTMSKDLLSGSPCLPATPTPAPTSVATPATPETTPGAGSPTAEAPSGSSVEIKDFAFNPASITITTGTTVTWTNNDAVPHTVTAKDGSFDSGTISPGDTFTHTFDTAGNFDYACSFHPNMLGTVVVQ